MSSWLALSMRSRVPAIEISLLALGSVQMASPLVTGVFTRAGAESIRQGADIAQVVNARSGMYTAAGRQLTTTAARIRGQGGIRLMPEQILREAGNDRDEAQRLLKRFGYLI